MQNKHRFATLARLAVFGLILALALSGCPGDDEDFQGADQAELENTRWFFGDARAFGLRGQAATLVIRFFGAGDLDDNEARFTLSTNPTATGILDLRERDFPFDASRCIFKIQESTFEEQNLQPGEDINLSCAISDDRTDFRLENQDTGQTSFGILQDDQVQ